MLQTMQPDFIASKSSCLRTPLLPATQIHFTVGSVQESTT